MCKLGNQTINKACMEEIQKIYAAARTNKELRAILALHSGCMVVLDKQPQSVYNTN